MRLYKEIIQQLFITLVYLKYLEKHVDFKSIYNNVYNYYVNGGFPPDIQSGLKASRIDYLDSEYSLDELIEILSKGIKSNSHSNIHEGDLIDILAELLKKSRFALNIITPKTVDLLRKAILDPSEVEQFRKTIQHAPLKCKGCGEVFLDHEAIVFKREGPEDCLYCMSCLPAEHTTCKNCKTKVPFSERFSTKRTKGEGCGHKVEKEILENIFRVGYQPIVVGRQREEPLGNLRNVNKIQWNNVIMPLQNYPPAGIAFDIEAPPAPRPPAEDDEDDD